MWKASKIYKVPKTTLHDHTYGRYRDVTGKMGRQLALHPETEESLVKYCTYMSTRGYPLTRKILQAICTQVVNQLKIKNPFNERWPSRKWIRSFLKRHKDKLSLRTPDPVDASRSALTQAKVDTYFSLLENLYAKNAITPSAIFNCDETGFSAKDITKVKVIARKGQKRAY